MSSMGMKLILPQEMVKESCQRTKGASKQSKKPRPKSFFKTYMKFASKETNLCWKIDKGGRMEQVQRSLGETPRKDP
jgi:poly-D-alanine transfer protein DltD